jgi:hypothetical protein
MMTGEITMCLNAAELVEHAGHPGLGVGERIGGGVPVPQQEPDPFECAGPVDGHASRVGQRGKQLAQDTQRRLAPAAPDDLAAHRLLEPVRSRASGTREITAVPLADPVIAAAQVRDRNGCRAVSSAAGHTHSSRARICWTLPPTPSPRPARPPSPTPHRDPRRGNEKSCGPTLSSRDQSLRPSASHRPNQSPRSRCTPAPTPATDPAARCGCDHPGTRRYRYPRTSSSCDGTPSPTSASGGRSYVLHRHAERLSMPQVERDVAG